MCAVPRLGVRPAQCRRAPPYPDVSWYLHETLAPLLKLVVKACTESRHTLQYTGEKRKRFIEISAEIILAHARELKIKITEENLIKLALERDYSREEAEDIAEKILYSIDL